MSREVGQWFKMNFLIFRVLFSAVFDNSLNFVISEKIMECLR